MRAARAVRASFLVLALAILPCCSDRSGAVRVEHKSSNKKATVYDEGELAGRVIFASGVAGIPASGANILVIDTESGKQMLEYLQKVSEPSCLKRLTGMETFLLELARSSAQAGHTPPTVSADADGYFLLPQVKPGAYLVVAYGRAGDIQAIWEQPAMVERFQAVMVKMVNPLLACSANDQDLKPSGLPPPTPQRPGQPQPPGSGP
ncbi:MAG TPA: hypothetical protein VMT20_24155 [Terriglobia bacterium]|nr:hypothetical protein [Terriglobia bacterium]